MDLIESQFLAIKERDRYCGASLTRNGSGTAVVTVPNVELPTGWNKPRTTVYFIVPNGYPMAKPDCFWADADLRLASGAMPANTGGNAGEGVPPGSLWFSWHANTWNPNKDALVTYMGMILGRLKEAR
jgi:hypothetical protein